MYMDIYCSVDTGTRFFYHLVGEIDVRKVNSKPAFCQVEHTFDPYDVWGTILEA